MHIYAYLTVCTAHCLKLQFILKYFSLVLHINMQHFRKNVIWKVNLIEVLWLITIVSVTSASNYFLCFINWSHFFFLLLLYTMIRLCKYNIISSREIIYLIIIYYLLIYNLLYFYQIYIITLIKDVATFFFIIIFCTGLCIH